MASAERFKCVKGPSEIGYIVGYKGHRCLVGAFSFEKPSKGQGKLLICKVWTRNRHRRRTVHSRLCQQHH